MQFPNLSSLFISSLIPSSLFSVISSTAATASNGCSVTNTQPINSDQNYTITIGELSRKYTVFIPQDYVASSTSGNPLILSFHGNGKSDWQQEQLSQMSNPEFNTDHVVVYPQGYKTHWQPTPYADQSASDLDFIAQLLPVLQNTFCIDTTRQYVAGKSIGGGMTDFLACDPNLGPQFAAFAPVSGAFYYDNPANYTACDPGSRVGNSGQTPMLEFHGLNDTVIPYHGSDDLHGGTGSVPNIPTWVKWWAVRNGCETVPSPTVTSLYGGHVKHIVYEGCGVEHYTTNPLGHDWPSTVPNFDNPDSSFFNATPIIMEWFRGHSL